MQNYFRRVESSTDEDQFLPTCSIFYSSNTIKTPLACIAAKVVRRHIFFCSSGFTLTRRDWFSVRGTLTLRDILQNHNTLLFLLLFFFVAPLACFFKNKRCLLTWYKLFSIEKVVQGFRVFYSYSYYLNSKRFSEKSKLKFRKILAFLHWRFWGYYGTKASFTKS
jgi:hypothetical protein